LEIDVRTLPALNHPMLSESRSNIIEIYINQGYGVYLCTDKGKDKFKDILDDNILEDISILEIDISESIYLSKTKSILLSGEQLLTGNKTIGSDELDLNIGEYVVHHDHGIGLVSNFLMKDQKKYIELSYAMNDKLLIPFSAINKIDKYIGSSRIKPKVTRLSSGSWRRIIKLTKQKLTNITKELLRLYSISGNTKISPVIMSEKNTEDVLRFSRNFKYPDTEDQILITNQITL